MIGPRAQPFARSLVIWRTGPVPVASFWRGRISPEPSRSRSVSSSCEQMSRPIVVARKQSDAAQRPRVGPTAPNPSAPTMRMFRS